MADPEKRPDILVAIDLGTTFTGAGWVRLQPNQPALQSPMNIIQNWPGTMARNEQKVPTTLVYHPGGSLSSWGFLCEEDDGPGKVRREFFKIFLEEEMLRQAQSVGVAGTPASLAEAKLLVADFLRQVYAHVRKTVHENTGIAAQPGWAAMAVEFIFSVPTTWRSAAIVNNFKDAIAAAGFGSEGPLHRASVELTESEAAAVATLKRANIVFQPGDVFLSVDAGGGTTDLALVQVLEPREPFPRLRQVTAVDGVGIGSTLIDRGFVDYLNERLARFPGLAPSLPPDCVERLSRSDRGFKSTKHKFGESVYYAQSYLLSVDGLGYTFNYPAAGIQNGKIAIPHADVQGLFDPHIAPILSKIRGQMDLFQQKYPGLQMQYLNLSGGLGSSPYVRDRIQQYLLANPHACASRIRVIQDAEPQLVVVRGLLWDRMQNLDTGGSSILATRIARASYGVVCKLHNNPTLYPHHLHEDVEQDPLDGQFYVMRQIDWLIKKGDSVDTNTVITSPFKRKIESLSAGKVWGSEVVICLNEPQHLPHSLKFGTAKQLCTVRSNLEGVTEQELEAKKTRGGCCGRGKKYWYCNYEVRVVPMPAELRFEVWFNGRKFSGNHKPIEVTWDEAGAQLGNG